MGYEALWPAGTLAFGLWHRFVSAQTRNLSLSFLKLLVTTHGVQSLQRPGKPNSSRHATSPVTTETCIIASAGLHGMLAVSCAWYSCLSGLDHRPVLKISHASVFVPGRLFLSPLEVEIPQELCSLPLRKAQRSTGKRSFAHASRVLLDITSLLWNTLG